MRTTLSWSWSRFWKISRGARSKYINILIKSFHNLAFTIHIRIYTNRTLLSNAIWPTQSRPFARCHLCAYTAASGSPSHRSPAESPRRTGRPAIVLRAECRSFPWCTFWRRPATIWGWQWTSWIAWSWCDRWPISAMGRKEEDMF